MDKTALITGINGQDGFYLVSHLLSLGYRVIGLDIQSVKKWDVDIEYHEGSIADAGFLTSILLEQRPDEIYNLASISQVSTSFNIPEETFSVNLLPVVRMLELIRTRMKKTKFLQATSSEIFGGLSSPPFNESSLLEPLSPYAVSKEGAYHMVKLYRKAYGIFSSNAILFNHTSPVQPGNFVIPKIVKGLVAVKLGKENKLKMGNLDIERDWGYAEDYVKAMHLMVNYKTPDDFVVGTGSHKSIRYIVEYVVSKLGLDFDKAVEIDKTLFRLNDPPLIYSDPSKIKRELKWEPEKMIEDVLDMMIEQELSKQKGGK